jgi:hypothetical protein
MRNLVLASLSAKNVMRARCLTIVWFKEARPKHLNLSPLQSSNSSFDRFLLSLAWSSCKITSLATPNWILMLPIFLWLHLQSDLTVLQSFISSDLKASAPCVLQLHPCCTAPRNLGILGHIDSKWKHFLKGALTLVCKSNGAWSEQQVATARSWWYGNLSHQAVQENTRSMHYRVGWSRSLLELYSHPCRCNSDNSRSRSNYMNLPINLWLRWVLFLSSALHTKLKSA